VIGPGHGVRLDAAEVVAGAVVCPGDVGPPVDPAGVGVCSSTGEGLADEDAPGAERIRSRKCQRGTVGPPVSHRRVGYPQVGGTAPDATRASQHLSHT
jgi:hypothetical protein